MLKSYQYQILLKKIAKIAFLVFVSIFSLPQTCFGQAFTGSISGIVTDSSGAAMTDVSIIVIEVNRNVEFRGTTNQQGFYSISPLQPGTYRVRAEKSGFRQFVLDTLPISAQQKANVDIVLQVGEVGESIEVTAKSQLMQTTTSELGTVTSNQQIVNLPLNGRNVQSLVLLTPGVVGMSSNGGPSESYESQGRFVVNGGRDSSSAIQLDGVSVDMPSYIPGMNFYSAVPSSEGVQEFRIQTNAFSAEYGRTGGGIVTMVTKSGTNQFHGSLYEYLRNSALDANSFFNNARGVPLGSFKRNEFGATLGGPVILPKLLNGKNRSFFFVEYQGRRQSSGSTNVATLPTALERIGDFSQTRNAAGQLIQIFNPYSTREDPVNPGKFLRDPFMCDSLGNPLLAESGGRQTTGTPCNKIPQNLLSQVALNTQQYYPQPNRPGLPFTNQQNYVENETARDLADRGSIKFDQVLTDKQRIFFRYVILNWNNSAPQMWGAGNPGCPDPYCVSFSQRQQNAVIDYTNTLSNSLVFNLSYGFARGILDRGSDYRGFRPSTLGLPSSLERGEYTLFPQFTITNTSVPGVMAHWNFRTANVVHTLRGNLTKIAGKHTIKFGAETRVFLVNQMQATYVPAFDFSTAGTQGPDPRVASTSSGSAYASFLLGVGSGGYLSTGIRPADASNYVGTYIQDDVKLSRNLTVNVGLRWDIEGGTRERYGRTAVFNPDVASPLGQMVGMNLRGGYEFPGSIHPYGWKNFGPRVGLAYQLAERLVLRTGYGIFFGVPAYSGVFTGPMYSATTPWITSIDGVTPYRTLDNPYPDGYIEPEGSQNGLLAAISSGVNAPVPATMKAPYNQQWNFSIQYTPLHDLLIEAAYAGNKGTHLPLSWQMNQLDPSLVSADALQTVNNPFSGIIPSGTLGQPTVQLGQLLRPYPQYDSVVFASMSSGNSNYHSLQLKVEKRFALGASAMLAYTWSKLIDDGGTNAWIGAGDFRNFYCRKCERGLSAYDQPHRLVANFTYELPFGRGKAWGSNWNRALDAVLGNWQVNGILTYNTSRPLVFGVIQNTSNSFGGAQHADTTGVNASLGKSERTLERWFDTSQFSLPSPFTFGSLGRTTNLRADAFRNIDFSIFKGFKVREGLEVQFRAESFNLLNQVVFSAPNTQVGGPTFGQVSSQDNGQRQLQFALKLLF
jgi:carboxypeptidase family protein